MCSLHILGHIFHEICLPYCTAQTGAELFDDILARPIREQSPLKKKKGPDAEHNTVQSFAWRGSD